jgi:hypothetical protein
MSIEIRNLRAHWRNHRLISEWKASVNKGEKMSKKKVQYSIVRCQGAGVFMAQVVSRSKDGTQARLKDSRRLWYWSGAASLSQLAVEGTKKPKECKFPVAMPEHEVTGVLEIIPVTDAAEKSIKSVPVWSQ